MTEPSNVEAYRLRAANRPEPDGFVTDSIFTPEHHERLILATSTFQTFSADTSEFQPYIDIQYPYDAYMFRLHTGGRLDNKARGNWTFAEGNVKLNFGYVVFQPGQNNVIMRDLKNNFGANPHNLVPMTDMESGQQFAGPGNHSPEANDLAAMLAEWSGSWNKDYAYANVPDYAACWAQIDSRLKKHVAKYSSVLPNFGYGTQYFGGLSQYASPAGFPRSCPPFGGWVDMNHFPRSVDQMMLDLGIVGTKPPVPVAADNIMSSSKVAAGFHLTSLNKRYVAQFQTDGNFVVYDWSFNPVKPIWSSKTAGRGDHLAIQGDGNVVIYAGTVAQWATGTDKAGPIKLIMQDDGDLVLYKKSDGKAVWSSKGGKI